MRRILEPTKIYRNIEIQCMAKNIVCKHYTCNNYLEINNIKYEIQHFHM